MSFYRHLRGAVALANRLQVSKGIQVRLWPVALRQEALQALFKQALPTIYDGRDLFFDLTGALVAYLALSAWHWARLKVRPGAS